MKNRQDIVRNLKELAGKDLKKFFTELEKKMSSDSSKYKIKIIQLSRYRDNEENKQKRIISMEEYGMKKNEILSDCLDLCDNIEDIDLLLLEPDQPILKGNQSFLKKI
jgi:inorganic pyrophosphatase/exopolyphosphatase